MTVNPGLYQLPFEHVKDIVESGLQALPQVLQYRISLRELVGHLLEELSVKISDVEATSAIDRAVKYLEINGVDESYARPFCHDILTNMWMTVVTHFPQMNWQDLARGRYILEEDNRTLLVDIKS